MRVRLGMLVLVLAAFKTSVGLGTEQTGIEDYRAARPLFWSKVYPQGGITLYCGWRFGARKGRRINVEHVFPMSWVTKALRCGDRQQCRNRSERFNRIEADLHNLYPARLEINDTRRSFAYGLISGERRRFGACDFEVDYKKRQVEPRAASRGEIARAMLYMHANYGLKLYRRQGKLMQRWNRDDPPTREEKQRNDAIAQLQGTRNNFIDAPRAADDLGF